MAEEQDKKDDEKVELDSTGQAVAYKSLDQARVLVLQHARDNRDVYGRRYAQRDLVWEELNAEESEDYYRVTLSYRPTPGFQGEPGVEQFTIYKSGPIRLRRILGEPQPHRKLGLPLALAGVAVVVAAGRASGGR